MNARLGRLLLDGSLVGVGVAVAGLSFGDASSRASAQRPFHMPPTAQHRGAGAGGISGAEIVPAFGAESSGRRGAPRIDRIARFLGAGWGDGYHACESSGFRPLANLPLETPAGPPPRRRRAGATPHPHSPGAVSSSFYHRFDALAESIDSASMVHHHDHSYEAIPTPHHTPWPHTPWPDAEAPSRVAPESPEPAERSPAQPESESEQRDDVIESPSDRRPSDRPPSDRRGGRIADGESDAADNAADAVPAKPELIPPGRTAPENRGAEPPRSGAGGFDDVPDEPSVDLDDVLPTPKRSGQRPETGGPDNRDEALPRDDAGDPIDLDTYFRGRTPEYNASVGLGQPQPRVVPPSQRTPQALEPAASLLAIPAPVNVFVSQREPAAHAWPEATAGDVAPRAQPQRGSVGTTHPHTIVRPTLGRPSPRIDPTRSYSARTRRTTGISAEPTRPAAVTQRVQFPVAGTATASRQSRLPAEFHSASPSDRHDAGRPAASPGSTFGSHHRERPRRTERVAELPEGWVR